MNIPQNEKKTKEDIIEYIKKCAKQYVPEWRYDQEHPDAGTALVSLFADMMCDNIKRFNLSAAGDMFSFFDELNAKMLPARPAEGFITFELPEGFIGEAEVPTGTKLLSETPEGQLIFETQEEVLVRQMDIKKIYLSNPKEDAIYQVFDGEAQEVPSFFLFQSSGDNLQKHRLYFCFERGLMIKTHAQAELSFQLLGTGIEEGEFAQTVLDASNIRFFYGTLNGYRSISDYTYEDGKLKFDIEGGEQGIAPMDEFQSMYVIRADILDARLFSKVYISALTLCVRGQNLKPELIHVNGTDQEPEDFPVFGEAPTVYNEFYLASEEVFGKAGAHIRIEFDLDFVKIPLEAVMAENVKWKTIMKKRDFIPDREYDITIRQVIWEYYNGYGWTRLHASSKYEDMFTAYENVHGQRKKMEFICPPDIQPALVNSAETYCIRARVIKMNNAFKTKGAYIVPVAGRFSLSYDFEGAPLTPALVFRQNNMETRSSKREDMEQKSFAFPFSEPNPDEKTTCYLGFEEPPVGGPLKLLFVMHDAMQKTMPRVEWEYLGEEGFQRMPLIDGTKGFHHTGLVSWFGSRDLKRTVLFEQNLFWIRLIDAEESYQNKMWKDICPKIEGIYPNSTSILGIETVEASYGIEPHAQEKKIQLPYTDISDIQIQVLERKGYRDGSLEEIWETWMETDELYADSDVRKEYVINRQEGILEFPKYMKSTCLNEQGEIAVRVKYEHCQGDLGNLKAGQVNQLSRTVGFINNSYNPVATVCGTSGEKVMEAVERNAKILRHGYRCVSSGDYEDMAFEATRNISKIKCFCGYDQNRKQQAGAVTLVVLPKEYGEESYSFEKTKTQIYEYLAGHMDENIVNLGKFHIVRPQMIRMDIKATVTLTQKKEIFTVRKRILDELHRFLNPLHGNFYGEGWEIGTIPNKSQIMHALKRVEGVKYVKELTLRKYRRGRFEEYEVNEENLLSFYLLPKSGTHEILIDM